MPPGLSSPASKNQYQKLELSKKVHFILEAYQLPDGGWLPLCARNGAARIPACPSSRSYIKDILVIKRIDKEGGISTRLCG